MKIETDYILDDREIKEAIKLWLATRINVEEIAAIHINNRDDDSYARIRMKEAERLG
jgi:hypothetical protein